MDSKPVIERVSQQDLEILQTALKAIPEGAVGTLHGTLHGISFGSLVRLKRSAKIVLYVERKSGMVVETFYWFADFDDKIECDLRAESLGYKDFSALLADPNIRFVEKIIIS